MNIEKFRALTPELFIGQWFTFSTKDDTDIIDVFIANIEQFNLLTAQSEIITMAENKIKIASLSELKKMEKKCGRPIDLADILLIDEIM